jgi:tape measure domain-containing protein
VALNAGQLRANLSLNFQQFSQGLRQVSNQTRNIGSNFRNSFNQATQSVNGTSQAMNNARRQMKDFERVVSGIIFAQAFYNATNAIQGATSALVTFMNNMEKAQISLEYFLGSPERAQGFLTNMKDFAATTSFNTEQALMLSRKLMAAQFDPKQVRGVMEVLNDASAASGGTPEQMDRIVLALSQIKTNGKIAGQEMRQLAEAGIPIYKILQEELQLTGEEIMNIGDMKISGDLGVAAILNGLEKRYKGAALRIADTLPGMWETIKDDMTILSAEIFEKPYKAMTEFLRGWRDTLEKARDALNKGGLGQVLETLFPPELHTSIRLITASIGHMAQSFLMLHNALFPIIQLFSILMTQAMGTVVPALAMVIRVVAGIVSAAFQAIPGLQYLVIALMGLLVAQGIARSLMFLWSVMRIGTIAAVVAQAVTLLRVALQALFFTLARNPITGLIMIISGALLYLAMSSKTVSGWLDQVIARLASLGGFDVGKTLQPETKDLDKWAEEFNGKVDGIGKDLSKGLDGAGGGLGEGLGDKLKDAGKKGKKAAKEIKDSFIAAFDEVYQIPDKKDADKGSGSGKGSGGKGDGGGGGGLGDMAMPDIGGLPDASMPKLPREVEMPKLVWPDIDWPLVPPALKKPIDIRFNIHPPNWPPPPTAFATVWQTSMNAIRAALKAFGDALSWVGQQVPKLLPQLNPAPVLAPVLKGVKGWSDRIKEAFDDVRQQVPQSWSSTWQTVQGATKVATSVLGKQLDKSMEDVKKTTAQGLLKVASFWEKHGATIQLTISTLGTAMVVGFKKLMDKIKYGIQTALNWIADFWEKHKVTILITVGVLIAGIVAFFVGLPAAVIAAVTGLVARLGPAFARIGPAFFAGVRNIPSLFSKAINNLPRGASNIVTRIKDAFVGLPGKIWSAIKSIPSTVAGVFAKIKLPSFSTVKEGISASFRRLGDVAGFASGGIIGKDSIVRVGEKGKREAIIPLQNQSAMQPFVDSVVQGLRGAGNPGEPTPSGGSQLPIVYVQNMIGDERGLRELERKLRVVRLDLAQGGRGG